MNMKPNGTMKFLNKQPYLLFSHQDLMRVKHIVRLAPQEAQWFHCVTRVVDGNHVYYKLTEMLIPEQTCSAAEVDTSSEMMVSFYKQLKEQFGDDTNQVMASMTCWCHSHHNMGVGPSGQDRKQFKEQVELAQKRDSSNPQIMIIFNKKDDYYCQIFDPELDIYVENAPLLMEGYDFQEYTEIAKKNFKKKVIKQKPVSRSVVTSAGLIDWGSNNSASQNLWSSKKKPHLLKPRKEIGQLEGLDLNDIPDYIESTITESDKSSFHEFLENVKEKNPDINKFLRHLESYFTASELYTFDLLLTGKEEEIRVLEESYPDEIEDTIDNEGTLVSLYEYFSDNYFDDDDFYTALAVSKLLCAETITLPESEHLVDYWLDYYNCVYSGVFHKSTR